MSARGVFQIVLYFTVLSALAWPLGGYMARMFNGDYPRWVRPLQWIERVIYALGGVQTDRAMSWQRYAHALIAFNVIGTIVVYAVQRAQHAIGWLNPQDLPAVAPDSAFNTAVSFATNTNWQGYGGESTMSYLTQMVALTPQNFVSAATGIAVLIALVRGFTTRQCATLGNFWVDLTRSTVYVLLPLSVLLALFLSAQGVVQNFHPAYQVPLIEPVQAETTDADGRSTRPITVITQQLPQGPAASQVAIKQLGTNGGGFFNVNSAHPYENPTPLTNFIESIAILLLPAALCFSFGRMVGDARQGLAVYAAMSVVFLLACSATVAVEEHANPAVLAAAEPHAIDASAGNMEGKEQRIGAAASAIWAVATTAASNGSVNAMHDSFLPLGGLVPMWMMQLGEVIFGGVGSGLYGMLIFVIVTVFIAGQMIGRAPQYLAKKIEAYEIKMAALAILIPPLVVLAGTALAAVVAPGLAGISNPGIHGFSQLLYAFSSAGNNNGSAFAGLSANTLFYNATLAVAMWIARFAVIVPVLAIAGSLAAKKSAAVGSGSLPTHGALFVLLLIGTVLVVGALTFVPALALGPIAEHLALPGTGSR